MLKSTVFEIFLMVFTSLKTRVDEVMLQFDLLMNEGVLYPYFATDHKKSQQS